MEADRHEAKLTIASELLCDAKDVAATFARAAWHSFAQTPMTGLAEVFDEVCGTDIAKKLQFCEAEPAAALGTLDWHAQQLGAAAGSMRWQAMSSFAVKKSALGAEV